MNIKIKALKITKLINKIMNNAKTRKIIKTINIRMIKTIKVTLVFNQTRHFLNNIKKNNKK